ncbi:MAG: aminoglycoside phosphotransferase family protein [Rhodobacterales bacterium]|nr:aminoglycoside phosphotransferase family protein [Rhodobacterales bacterium]
MTVTAAPDRVFALMRSLGLATRPEEITLTPLTGGVSSDIVLVETAGGRYCVKFALPKLKVAADWQVPVSRNAAEYDWLSYVAGINPALVPRLFGQDPGLGGFAMAFLPPERFPNWKALLMDGHVDVPVAAAVGRALGRIHSIAAKDPATGPRFPHQDNFHALRLEPYLLFAASRHPDLSPRLVALVDSFHAARISLVHGDVSPKNILCGPDGPVFLDAECAVQGDPAFDPAFCLNHLVIKASAAIADPARLAEAARALWAAYVAQVDWEDAGAIEARVAGILPALMLGRVDGKSPVEYLDPAGQDRLRQLARRLLIAQPDGIAPIIAAAQEAGESL